MIKLIFRFLFFRVMVIFVPKIWSILFYFSHNSKNKNRKKNYFGFHSIQHIPCLFIKIWPFLREGGGVCIFLIGKKSKFIKKYTQWGLNLKFCRICFWQKCGKLSCYIKVISKTFYCTGNKVIKVWIYVDLFYQY